MKADGSDVQHLTDGTSDNNLADFSPNGHKILFISDHTDPITTAATNWESVRPAATGRST